MSNLSADSVVVGNGAIGTSIAFELARRGQRVALVGERHRPFAASTAAGAMLGCFGEVTTPLLASESGRSKLAADYLARSYWSNWDDDLSAMSGINASLFSASGTVILLNTMGTAKVDSGNYKAIQSALAEYEEPFENVDPEDLDWFQPDELARSLRAMFIPAEHAVDAERLLEKLTLAFRNVGGNVVHATASSVEIEEGTISGVRLTHGDSIRADHVIIAAGVRSLELLDQVSEIRKMIPPLVSGYGVSGIFETENESTPTSVLRTPNRAFACGIHCISRGGGELYVGGTNVLTVEPRTTATVRDLQFLLECAVDQLYAKLPQAGLKAVQVGNRPVPADGFPLIGETSLDGLWIATGTYRDGLHQSPLIAKHIAAGICGGDGVISELSEFVPERPPLSGGSRGQIVETAVEHMLASGYETRWRVTPEWPPRIADHLLGHYTEIADSLHGKFTPPAEFIPKMTDGLRLILQKYYEVWS